MDEAANSTAIPSSVDPFGDSYEAVFAYVRNVLTSHGTKQVLEIRPADQRLLHVPYA